MVGFKKNQFFLQPDEGNFKALVYKLNKALRFVCQGSETSLLAIREGKTPSDYLPKGFYKEELIEGTDFSEILKEWKDMFAGQIRWHSPYAGFNVTPSPLLDTVVGKTLASLYNPNALWDKTSGQMIFYEMKILALLSEIFGWDKHISGGFSTFGGKATIFYGLRIGLLKAFPSSAKYGLSGRRVVLFVSEAGHYSLESLANYLGIGTENCIRVRINKDGTISIPDLRDKMSHFLDMGCLTAGVVLLGADTIFHIIDDVKGVYDLREELVMKYKLSYRPHIHLDIVNGWIWRFFYGYDFDKNPDKIQKKILSSIRSLYSQTSGIMWADSAGVDFHKLGLCPYISSYFLVKNRADLNLLKSSDLDSTDMKPGFYHVHHLTLENSRSADGIIVAWTVLRRLGISGFRRYLSLLLSNGYAFRQLLEESPCFEVLNSSGDWMVTLFRPKSPCLDMSDTKEGEMYVKAFYDYINSQIGADMGDCTPLFGYVPRVELSRDSEEHTSAIMFYPMSVYLNRKISKKIIRRIEGLKRQFDLIYSKGENIADLSFPAPPK